jgi:glycosyltransferase involved in cell wall biosynthesis
LSRQDRSPTVSSPAASNPEISVVMAVRDGEDRIGYQVKEVASHLRSLGRTFEVIAVNDGSRDNSLPILELLAARLPELRIVRADAAGRAYQRGAVEARGSILLLFGQAERIALAPLGWALARIAAGRDAVMLRGRYVVGRTLAVVPVIARVRGPSPLFERLFERRAQHLRIDVVGSRSPVQSATARLLDPVLRFLTVS